MTFNFKIKNNGTSVPTEIVNNDSKKPEDDWIKRHEAYSEWNKTHDNYKILYAPDGRDEHGKRIKYD